MTGLSTTKLWWAYLGYMQCQFLGDDCNWIFEYYNDGNKNMIHKAQSCRRHHYIDLFRHVITLAYGYMGNIRNTERSNNLLTLLMLNLKPRLTNYF